MLSPRGLVRGNPARAKFAAENTGDFDAIFFIARYGINPYSYSGFLWARCSPWDIEQRVGPSALGLHLTGDVRLVWQATPYKYR